MKDNEIEKQLTGKIEELTRQVEALKIIEKDYREIVEHATEVIFKVDAAGNFYFVSAEFGRVLGYTSDQMIGSHFASIVHPDDLKLCLDTFSILAEFGKAEDNIRFRVKHASGHYKWVDCSAVCLFDENGIPTHSIGFAHDVTQLQNLVEDLRISEKALRISEERYRSLFDALREGIILIDNTGKIIACNRSAEKICNAPKEVIINYDAFDSTRPYLYENGSIFPAGEHPSKITLKTGKSFQNVVLGAHRHDGTFCWISLNTEPIYYTDNRENPDAVVASFVDITQSKEDKAELLRGQQMLALEKDVLEINAQPQASLKLVVDYLLKGLEKISPEMTCSVSTPNPDGKRIAHLSAPGLPLEFATAVDGCEIGPYAGSCGTAMYLKQVVITENIYTDHRWKDFIWLADKFNFSACWSFPVLNTKNEVLATIAVYHKKPTAPRVNEYNFFDKVRNLLRIIIENKKAEAEVKLSNEKYIEATRAMAQAVVDAQEKERAEIGYELHDNVNQLLSTSRLYLDLAKNDEMNRIELILRSSDGIASAVNEIRSISRSLVPASIGDLGLIASIEDLVENVLNTKKLNVEFRHKGEVESIISGKQKLMLFRIIQEQVTNVLKHANASNLVIELLVDHINIHLSISDDGKGFDKESIKTKKGVGLHNIANRVELFNGKVNMITSPGNGCKLNILIPVNLKLEPHGKN